MNKIVTIFVLALMTLFLSGCFDKKKDVLRIAISPWPGYEAFVLGVEKNFYEELDLKVVRYATPSESFRALRDGIVDVAAFTADEVLHYAEVRDKPKMFLILDISNGADAIVARPEIQSLDDLKGKRVYIEDSALGDYIIKRAMDFSAKTTINDVQVTPIELSKHLQLYKENKADALVTYEPYLSELKKEGAHVIFDSKQIPREIVDVLVANNMTIHKEKEVLKKLLKGWYKTQEYIAANKKEAMAKMASYEYITAQEFEKSYDTLIVPNREESAAMLNGDNGTFYEALERLSQQMLEKGSLKMKIETAPLLDSCIIKEDTQ